MSDNPSSKQEWPETLIAILIFVAFLLFVIPVVSSTQSVNKDQIRLELKAADLAGGASLAHVDEYVTLVTAKETDQKTIETSRFDYLKVRELLDETGRSVVYTGDLPATIVLDVPAFQFDAVVQALQEKKAAYLLSQSQAAPTPTPSPPPTSAPPPTVGAEAKTVVFALPVAKIQSEWKQLRQGPIDVILVSERKDDAGKIVTYDTKKYDATWLDVLDAQGVPVMPAADTAASVRISIESGAAYTDVMSFAGQLPSAAAIYLLPKP